MTETRIPDYPHRTAGHCGSGALRDLLEWAGLGWGGAPGEGLVFGLSGGLSFMYTRTRELQPPIYFVGRGADLELGLCRRLGIVTDALGSDNADEGWRWLTDEIDAGRPVLIHTDIAELPYLRVRLSNTLHAVVVIGYDATRGIAWVVDNDREAVQEVPLDALARARHSGGFPYPNRHATFPMQFPGRLPNLLPVARDAAATAVGHMRRGTAPLFNPSELSAGATVATGIVGIQTFADDLASWPTTLGDDGTHRAVTALPVFVEKAGTGGGLYRQLQAEFCADVARLTGDSAFDTAAAAYRDCASAWSEVAARASAETSDLTAIAAAAAALPAIEHRALTALEKASMVPA